MDLTSQNTEDVAKSQRHFGGTAAAAPPPFRPSDPALCGSHPLVTPYYCRLGDLLCLFVYIVLCVIIVYVYVYLVVFVVFFLFCSISFSTLMLLVGSFDL